MDILLKAAPSCSPAEIRAEAQEMHDLVLKQLATLKKEPESDLRSHKIADLEKQRAEIAGFLAFKSEATGKGRGSSYSVPAAGERGDQGERDIVTRQEEIHTVHFTDGSTKDVNVVVTDEKGNRLPDEVITKTARDMAQDIKTREHNAAQGARGRRVVGQNVEGDDPTKWEVGTEVDEGGINVAPSTSTKRLSPRAGAPREVGSLGEAQKRPIRTEEGKKKVAKKAETKRENEEKKQKFITGKEKSGEDGAHYLGGNKWLVVLKGEVHGEVPGKRGASEKDVIAGVKADLASKAAEKQDLRDRYEAAWKGAQARGQSREDFENEFYQREAKPKPKKEASDVKEASKPIISVSDIPDHRKDERLGKNAHKMGRLKYKNAVENFYRDTMERISDAWQRKRSNLLKRKGDFETEEQYDSAVEKVDDYKKDLEAKMRDRIAYPFKEHADLVRAAYARGAEDIHPNNIRDYDPGGKQKKEARDATMDSLIGEMVGDKTARAKGKEESAQESTARIKDHFYPLRHALGLEGEQPERESALGVANKLKSAGVGPMPTELVEGEDPKQVLEDREGNIAEISENTGVAETRAHKNKLLEKLGFVVDDEDTAKQTASKRKKFYYNLPPDQRADVDAEVDYFLEDFIRKKRQRGPQRGQTTAEAKNKKQLLDWVSGVKDNVREYLDSIIKRESTEDTEDTEHNERVLRDVEAEFQNIMAQLGEKLTQKAGASVPRTKGQKEIYSIAAAEKWSPRQKGKVEYENPIFDSLSKESQDEIFNKLTSLEKSVIDSLNPSRKILMSGLFLDANLFKALNLSEKHKIEKYKNSFGQGTSGVNPVTMNSELFEKDEEEKDDDKVKKSLNLGFYVGV